jgi:hypothetical protein
MFAGYVGSAEVISLHPHWFLRRRLLPFGGLFVVSKWLFGATSVLLLVARRTKDENDKEEWTELAAEILSIGKRVYARAKRLESGGTISRRDANSDEA